MSALARFVATLGPVGSFPLAPATAASALVTLAGWFIPAPPLAVAIVLLALAIPTGAWVCGEAETRLGHDAKPIVFDELVGQSLTLLLAPRHPLAFVAAFLLFRVFDIWKPLGANQAQSLPGGWGVMMDDVIAGLSACVALHLLLWGAARAGFAI